jgi:hypothetical protein
MKKTLILIAIALSTLCAKAVTSEPLSIFAGPMPTCSMFSSIYISVSGGTPPYTYNVVGSYGPSSMGAFTSSYFYVDNLMPGNYTVTVTDATAQVAVVPGTVISFAFMSNAYVQAPVCPKDSGTVDIYTNPYPDSQVSYDYYYQINNSGVWNAFSDGSSNLHSLKLPAGTYSITLRNSFGCEASSNSVDITAPKEYNFTGVITQPQVAGQKGSVALSIDGGTAPYKYSVNKSAYNTLNTNKVISDLPAGYDTIYVKDVNGCEAQYTQTYLLKSVTLGVTNELVDGKTVFSANNAIQIEQAAGKQVCVFDVKGLQIYRGILKSDKEIIPVNAQGVYLVNIDGQTKKLIVR